MDGLVLNRIMYYLIEPDSIFWTDHDTAEMAHILGLVSKTGWTSDLSHSIWKKIFNRYCNTPELSKKELFQYYNLSRIFKLAYNLKIPYQNVLNFKTNNENGVMECLEEIEKYSTERLSRALNGTAFSGGGCYRIPLRMRPKITGQTQLLYAQVVKQYKISAENLCRIKHKSVPNPRRPYENTELYNTRDIRIYMRDKLYRVHFSNQLKNKPVQFMHITTEQPHPISESISGKVKAYPDLTYRIVVSRKKDIEKLRNLRYQLDNWIPTVFQIEGNFFLGEYQLRTKGDDRFILDMRLNDQSF